MRNIYGTSFPFNLQPGEFGIRLETVLRVVEKTGLRWEDKDDYGPFYGFEPVSFERNES